MTTEELLTALMRLGFAMLKPNPMNKFELTIDLGQLGQLMVWSRDGKEIITILEDGESAITILTTNDALRVHLSVLATLAFAGELRKI